MAVVYLSLGSNVGDCNSNLIKAIELVKERIGRVSSISAFYVTEPWGFTSNNSFLNAAIKVETDLSPQEVLEISQSIEISMGRLSKSNGGYVDRVIDLDLLFYDDIILVSERLSIPHSLLHLRSFVLQPMFDIAPDFIHPVLQRSIRQLFIEMNDKNII